MRENRQSGSAGGVGSIPRPYPYLLVIQVTGVTLTVDPEPFEYAGKHLWEGRVSE